MNCQKCKTPLKEGTKFCTICGHKTEWATKNSGLSCAKCAAPLKQGAKFCIGCGTPVSQQPLVASKENNSTATNLSVVKDRIFWNIQNGELAHRFNEAELMDYDSSKGIIINEGTTAYVRADGETVAEIQGGVYDFVAPDKLNQVLETRQGGIAGGLKRGLRFLSNLVLGTRVKDEIAANEASLNTNRETTLSRVIEDLKKNKVFSVTLKLDRSFPLIFEFPGIKTKIIDTTIGVHTTFRISDFKIFAAYYLSDNSSVTFMKVMNELSPIIKSSIEDVLYDFELVDSKLPDHQVNKIIDKINNSAKDLFNGLSLESIVSVSSNSNDIERFRALGRELYLSEKELDHLTRLNEFRNRMTLQVNTQRLTDARTELDFRKQMQEINKDELLTEDEMEKFYMLLSREKKIREAKNEDEIQTALTEIEKTGLLRDEDLANLKRSIREHSEDHDYLRFHSIDLMQMNQVLEIDKKKLEWEYEIGDKRLQLEIDRRRKQMQAEIGFTELEIEQWGKEDAYKDIRFDKELDKKAKEEYQDIAIDKAKKKTQIELDNEEMDAQIERMRKLKEMESLDRKQIHEQELVARAQELAHQQELEEKRLKEIQIKYQGAKDLSAEQLMAIAANEKLDPVAAQKFAESFSAKHNADGQKEFMEQFNKLNAERVDDVKKLSTDNADRMERMMNKMMDTSTTMTGHLIHNKDQQKDEYKDKLTRQEDRLDNTQDKALDYTTRNNSFQTNNPSVQNQQSNTPPPPVEYFLSLPGKLNIPHNFQEIAAMVARGEIKANTSVWAPSINNWAAAASIPELSFLFKDTGSGSKIINKTCKSCGFNDVEMEARFCPECGKEA